MNKIAKKIRQKDINHFLFHPIKIHQLVDLVTFIGT